MIDTATKAPITEEHVSRSRILALLGLLPFGLVRAPEIEGLGRNGTDPARVEEAVPPVSVVFEGIVFDSYGAPVENAVVVSSAGGQALTDRGGSYRIR